MSWWVARRQLPDGRDLFVVQMTFGKGRLTIGHGEQTYDQGY